MSQYPYGYGGQYPSVHAYGQSQGHPQGSGQQQQHYQTPPQSHQQQQQHHQAGQHPQAQQQQVQRQMWPQQQQPQQQQVPQYYMQANQAQAQYSMAQPGIQPQVQQQTQRQVSRSNVLPPGISVVRDASSASVAPTPAYHTSSSSPHKTAPPTSSGVPPPLLSESRAPEDPARPKHYKPLVKHFVNEPGFDLSCVKTEPGLLKAPPSLTPRPSPMARPPEVPGPAVSTTRTQSTESVMSQLSATAASPSNKSPEADSGLEEESREQQLQQPPTAEDPSSSTAEAALTQETEEEDMEVVDEEDDKSSISRTTLDNLEFFANLKNPVVGRDTLCIFCAQNTLDKSPPKLLSCLHTACSACLDERLKESLLKHQDNNVVDLDDLEQLASFQKESWVDCPLCKIKTSQNELAQNLLVAATDQAMDSEDPEGQICNSCDEGNAPSQWCRECSEYLCEDCVKAHQRVKMTKDHTLKLVLSSKKQLSSTSAAAASSPSLDAFKICSTHSTEHLDYYCDTCELATCRECQISAIHAGHAYRTSVDASDDVKYKFRQMASDVKLKRNTLEENRALLKTKLIEVEIKEKSLLNQLQDVQQYLIHKIQSRFKDLIGEATKAILDKRKAFKSRKDTLDRLFQQSEHSLAFVEHMVNFSWTEQSGGHLGILAAKRTVERQMRRLKKTDISTGLTDQSGGFKLDVYFQQYSGSSMHEGLDSCLKQMLADVKLLNGPPALPPPSEPSNPSISHPPPPPLPPPNSSHLESALKSQKIVLKRASEGPSSIMVAAQVQRFSSPKSSPPVATKRGAMAGGIRGSGRGLGGTPARGRGSASNARGRPGSRGSATMSRGRGTPVGRGTPSGRGARGGVSSSPGRGGVARGGITNSMRAKTLAPSALKGKPGLSIGSPAGRGASTPAGRGGGGVTPMARRPSQTHLVPKSQQQQQLMHQALQQASSMTKAPGPSSRPPVLKQMTQITVTSSSRDQKAAGASPSQPADHQQQQNNYFMAAYGQRKPPPSNPQAQQQQQQGLELSRQARMNVTGGSLSITPQQSPAKPTWHSPQASEAPNPPSGAGGTPGKTPDTSFKITLPPMSKAAPGPKNCKKDNSEINANSEGSKATPPPTNSLASLRMRSGLEIQRVEDKIPPKVGVPKTPPPNKAPSPPKDDSAAIEEASATTTKECKKLEETIVLKTEILSTEIPDAEEVEGGSAEDWCAICHDGGDVQYCCDRCPKVYHLYCYIPPLSNEPPDDWVCLMCATVDEVYLYSNNVEKGKLGERDLMICRRLLFELFNQYPQSSSFKDRKDLHFQAYLEVVKEPIALDLIKERLSVDNPDQYSSIEEFLADVRRMFKNCYLFHDKDSHWYQHAKELEEYLDRKLEEWMPQLAYDQTIISSAKSRKKKANEPTPGPSKKKKKRSEETESDPEPSTSGGTKKKKKSKKSKEKAKHEDLDNDSESFSEGEKLDYLDNLEAKLSKNKRGSEGVEEPLGKGSRIKKKTLKMKFLK